jgi:cell division protein ZapA
MPKLDVNINQHHYTLACDEGEQEHVMQLAAEVQMRAEQVVKSMPRANEATTLVMTALMLADELYEARQEAGALHERIRMMEISEGAHGVAAPTAAPAYDMPVISREEAQQSLALALDEVATHVERMTQKLEKDLPFV